MWQAGLNLTFLVFVASMLAYGDRRDMHGGLYSVGCM